MKECLGGCGKQLTNQNITGYCRMCLTATRRAEKIKLWLETGDLGMTVATTIRGVIRDYIYNEQDNKCAICGMSNIWNEQELNFVLDHIDGDAANGQRINLRLVCPNCDSQLDTFKSRNKDSARTHRQIYGQVAESG